MPCRAWRFIASFADAVAALKRISAMAGSAAEAAANEMASDFTREVQIVLRARSHPFATRTPSLPGEPPAKISGRLADSLDITPAVAIGGDAYLSRSGPTIVYARIQELGGEMQGHPLMRWREDGRLYFSSRHSLPRRPYMKPTAERMEASGALTGAAMRGFSVVIDSVT